MSSWRLPLRLARRDALRARGRSILVLVMIALPVLAVSAAVVSYSTQNVSPVESLDRRLGTAPALVTATADRRPVLQGPDPDEVLLPASEGEVPKLTAGQISKKLDGARLLELRQGSVPVETDKGVGYTDASELDLTDSVTRGLVDLTSGRLPEADEEVVINAALAAKGYRVGDTLRLTAKGAPENPTIVGIAESATLRDYPVAVGLIGSLDPTTYGSSWLVDGGPVTWAQVRALNAEGAAVLSRAVVLDPPPLPPRAQEYLDQYKEGTLPIVVLVVVMALLEVVLLAGPAFAVGARRQARSLALMSAAGGTPAQSRKVVLATAVVLGGVASVLGVGLGIGVAAAIQPYLQGRSSLWFGPFEVPWLALTVVGLLGVVSALLASVVPAWIASRQDVVAVLAGRRANRRPSLRSPVLGVVLLGAGIATAAYGARGSGPAELMIGVAAIVAVLGMILLVPVVLVACSALSRWLPLTLRYAVRDAARHRTRTVPAVAAVAATVAGVVALGIAVSSDEADGRNSYQPSLASGLGVVTAADGPDSLDFSAAEAVLARELPSATVTPMLGVGPGSGGYNTDTKVTEKGHRSRVLLESYSYVLGADLLVDDDGLPEVLGGFTAEERALATSTLASGGTVAFTDGSGTPSGAASDSRATLRTAEIAVRVRVYDIDGGSTGPDRRATLPALVLTAPNSQATPKLVLSTAAARTLDVRVDTVGLALSGAPISAQEEEDASEALTALSSDALLYVERGYVADDSTELIQLILGGLGAVLMLGGTLTATFLALSDARPDLATLSAVGASPRTRRTIAGSYALVVGLVGAGLGSVVGFIPGIAITYPLTRGSGGAGAAHYVDVPWLLILGLVVALPLFTALVVGLTARSRLPLVARLD